MINIEFIGSPGSGKTTIRNLLAKEFERFSVKTLDNKKLILYGFLNNSKNKLLKKIAFFLLLNQLNFMENSLITRLIMKNNMHFKKKEIENFMSKKFRNFNKQYNSFIYLFFKKIKSNKSLNGRSKFIERWIYNEGVAYKISKEHKQKKFILLNSEGFFQRSIRYFETDFKNRESKISSKLVNSFLATIPKTQYLIYVKTSVKNSKERISKKNISSNEKDKLINSVNTMSKISDKIFKKFNKKKIKILKIDGNKNLDDNINLLLQFFKKELITQKQ